MGLWECWLFPTLAISLGRAALIGTMLSQPKGPSWCLGWKFQSHLVGMYFFLFSCFIFLSKEAHPHFFGGMQNVSFKFSGFSNAFPEFQKSLFAKVNIFA